MRSLMAQPLRPKDRVILSVNSGESIQAYSRKGFKMTTCKSYYHGLRVDEYPHPQVTRMEADGFNQLYQNLQENVFQLPITRDEFNALPRKAARKKDSQSIRKLSIPYFIPSTPTEIKQALVLRSECKYKAFIICIDIDDHKPSCIAKEILPTLPFNYLWYETVSSVSGNLRIRILIDCDGLSPEEYALALPTIANFLGLPSQPNEEHGYDGNADGFNQPMFKPTYFKGEEPIKIHRVTNKRAFNREDIDQALIGDSKNHLPQENAIELDPPAGNISTEDVKRMLGFIDPDISRNEWKMEVLCGIRHQLQNDESTGRQIARDWSRGKYWSKVATKFDETSFSEAWRTIQPWASNGSSRTIASVIRLAQQNGYIPPRTNPAIDKDEPRTVYLPSGKITANDTAEAISEKLGSKHFFFKYAGQLVTVTDGNLETITDPYRFGVLVEEQLRFKAWVIGYNKEPVVKEKKPPIDDLKRILKSRALLARLPSIMQVVNSPYLVFGKDGIKQLERGYNPSTGIYVIGSGSKPERVELSKAIVALLGILKEFLFASEEDKARAVAMMLTPALKVGGFIRGSIPIDFAEATESQSGKTYRLQIIRALYNENAQIITGHDGGVGSFDEHVGAAITSGRMFVAFDNLRGRIDSTKLEAFITSDSKSDCPSVRLPHKGYVQVIPGRTIFQMSSNGLEMTEDLANRSCIVQIRKAPEDFEYTSYPEGDLKDHVRANQAFFHGCINAVIREWFFKGMPEHRIGGWHDFREWHGKLNWIVTKLFKLPTMMEGHREKQNRISNDNLTFIRKMTSKVIDSGNVSEWLRPHELVDFCESSWMPPGKELNPWTVGRSLARFMGASDYKEFEDWQIERLRQGDQKKYRFMLNYTFKDESSPLLP